jgi:hypothetical protein
VELGGGEDTETPICGNDGDEALLESTLGVKATAL